MAHQNFRFITPKIVIETSGYCYYGSISKRYSKIGMELKKKKIKLLKFRRNSGFMATYNTTNKNTFSLQLSIKSYFHLDMDAEL